MFLTYEGGDFEIDSTYDLWGLGLVMFFLVEKSSPFYHKIEDVTIVTDKEYKLPADAFKNFDKELRAILISLLSVNPLDRTPLDKCIPTSLQSKINKWLKKSHTIKGHGLKK